MRTLILKAEDFVDRMVNNIDTITFLSKTKANVSSTKFYHSDLIIVKDEKNFKVIKCRKKTSYVGLIFPLKEFDEVLNKIYPLNLRFEKFYDENYLLNN